MTERTQAFFADMTLEEKVDQMNQVAAGMFSGDITAMGPMAAKLSPPEVLAWTGLPWRHGSGSAEKASERADRKSSPAQNPTLFHMLDVINGFKTVYPIPLGQGASFDPELSGRCVMRRKRPARSSCDFGLMMDSSVDAAGAESWSPPVRIPISTACSARLW